MENNFNIQEMSEKTGISVILIKETLGIPLEGECGASDAATAKKMYFDSGVSTEESQLRLTRWAELETDYNEIRDIWSRSKEGTRANCISVKKLARFHGWSGV